MKLYAFDLETTGLDGNTARIVEFCFIELDAADPALRELSRWTEMVDPQMPIPPATTRVHGITDKMVRGRAPVAAFRAAIQDHAQGAGACHPVGTITGASRRRRAAPGEHHWPGSSHPVCRSGSWPRGLHRGLSTGAQISSLTAGSGIPGGDRT